MGRYLIDSNVIVNYTSENFDERAMIFLADVIDEIPNISVITKIENGVRDYDLFYRLLYPSGSQ